MLLPSFVAIIWYFFDDRYVLLHTHVACLGSHFVRCFLVMLLVDGVHHLLNIAHVDRVRPIGELVDDVLGATGDLLLRAHAPQLFRVESCVHVYVGKEG